MLPTQTCREERKKTPAISAPRSLDVVTMTTASIPWRSCVFCHGILKGGRGEVAFELQQQRASPSPPGRSLILSSPRRGCHPGARRRNSTISVSGFPLHPPPLPPPPSAVATRGYPHQVVSECTSIYACAFPQQLTGDVSSRGTFNEPIIPVGSHVTPS